MQTFRFDITASGADINSDYDERLLAAGCDDATIAFQGSAINISFARQALSFHEAVASALGSVREAGLKVKRIDVGHV